MCDIWAEWVVTYGQNGPCEKKKHLWFDPSSPRCDEVEEEADGQVPEQRSLLVLEPHRPHERRREWQEVLEDGSRDERERRLPREADVVGRGRVEGGHLVGGERQACRDHARPALARARGRERRGRLAHPQPRGLKAAGGPIFFSS